MGPLDKSKHLIQLWHSAWRKALASYNVISFFNEIRSRFYLYGLSNNVDKMFYQNMIPPYILMPEDSVTLIWSIINIVLLLYTATVMPYKIAFIQSDSVDYLEYLVDLLFAVDILMTFFTAVQSGDIKDDKIVYDMKTIARRYIKSFFLIDVLACFPFQLVVESSSGGKNYNKLLRLMRLPRFFRIMRVVRVIRNMKALTQNKYFRKIEKYIRLHRAIIRMTQGVVICVIMTHIMGCMWFLTSQFADFGPETWVHRMNKQDSDSVEQYLQSFYWSSQTVLTIGYGDMPAQTVSEMMLASFWMLLGVGFYSFVVGNYTSMITEWVISDARIQVKVKKVKDMSIKLKFPPLTALHLTDFVQKNYKSLTMDSILRQDQAELFQSLPSNLKKEILSALYSKIVEKVKFFKEMNDRDFQWFLLPQLRQIKYDKDDLIYKRGDPADIIYYIYKGAVRMYSQKGYCFTRYEEGDMFGESDTLFKLPRDCHAMSQTHVILYTLKVDYAFLKASKEYSSNLKNMIKQAKTKRLEHTTLMMTVDNPFIMRGNQRRQYKNNVTFKSLKTFKETGKTPSHMNLPVAYEDSFKTSSISEFSEVQQSFHKKPSHRKKQRSLSDKSSSSSSSQGGGVDQLLAIPQKGKAFKTMQSKVSAHTKNKRSGSSSSLQSGSQASDEKSSRRRSREEDEKSEDSEQDKSGNSESESGSSSSSTKNKKTKVAKKLKTIQKFRQKGNSKSQTSEEDSQEDEDESESNQSNSSGLQSLIQRAKEEDQVQNGREINIKADIFEEIHSGKMRAQYDFKKFVEDSLSVIDSQREVKQTLGTHGTHKKQESTIKLKTQIQKQLNSHISKMFQQNRSPNSNMDAVKFKKSVNKLKNHFESDVLLQNIHLDQPLRLNIDLLKSINREPSSKKSSSYLSDRKSHNDKNFRRSFGTKDLLSVLRSERKFTMIEEEIKQEEGSFSEEEIKIEAQIDDNQLIFTERKETFNENESMLSQHYMFTKSKDSAQESNQQVSRKPSGIQRILSRAFSNLQQLLPKKHEIHTQLNEDAQKMSNNQSFDKLLSVKHSRQNSIDIIQKSQNSCEKSKFAQAKDNKRFFPNPQLNLDFLNENIDQSNESPGRISPHEYLKQPHNNSLIQRNSSNISEFNEKKDIQSEQSLDPTFRVIAKRKLRKEQEGQFQSFDSIRASLNRPLSRYQSTTQIDLSEEQYNLTHRLGQKIKQSKKSNLQKSSNQPYGVFEYAKLIEEKRVDDSMSSFTAIVIEQSFDDLSEMEERKRELAQQQIDYANYLENISILEQGLDESIKLNNELEYQQIHNQAKSPLFFQQNLNFKKPELFRKEKVDKIDLDRGYNYSEREIKFKVSQSQLQVAPNAAKRISAITQKVKQEDTINSTEDKDSLLPRRLKRAKSQSSSTRYKTSDQNPKTSLSPSHLNMQNSIQQMKRVSFNVEAKFYDHAGLETPNLDTPYAETPIQRQKMGPLDSSRYEKSISDKQDDDIDLLCSNKINPSFFSRGEKPNQKFKARISQPPLFPSNNFKPGQKIAKMHHNKQSVIAKRFDLKMSKSQSILSNDHQQVQESEREESFENEERKIHNNNSQIQKEQISKSFEFLEPELPIQEFENEQTILQNEASKEIQYKEEKQKINRKKRRKIKYTNDQRNLYKFNKALKKIIIKAEAFKQIRRSYHQIFQNIQKEEKNIFRSSQVKQNQLTSLLNDIENQILHIQELKQYNSLEERAEYPAISEEQKSDIQSQEQKDCSILNIEENSIVSDFFSNYEEGD